MTTGNLYLQVFNKASGRFIEIPENVGTISFLTSRTGFASFSQTPNFSGFVFSRPVRFNNSIEMAPINIGANNITGSGLGIEANVGFNNKNIITNLNLATGLYYGNYNFGTINSFLDNIHGYHLGYFNVSQLSELGFNIGGSNFISGSLNSYNVGRLNRLESGIDVYLFGLSNNLNSGKNTILLGNNDTLLKVLNSFIVGNSNLINTGENINNFGENNLYNNIQNSKVFGSSNILTNSQFQNFYGENNSSIDSNNNTIFGNSNSLFSGAIGNIAYGNANIFNSLNSKIYGDNNLIGYDVDTAFIYGSNNNLSGTSNILILGSNNTLDSFALDQLYLIELTGITGLGVGQTPFTGVTGYRMLGGYAGIPGSGGNNNFFVGNNNQTSLNNSVYTFGDGNQTLNNANSYIIGEGNYAERSDSSYVFGQNNSVSGFQNYIIGNNNIVRSGDYNSILIGMSHEFTGTFKVASVNIASVDSKIEINPSEIKLNAPSRAKFNNENIVVSSDLNSYLNSSNALSNSGVFLNNIFQDAGYSQLPDQIQLGAFSYSGREDRYYGGFSGANNTDLNAFRFSGFVNIGGFPSYSATIGGGFFRKREVVYYTGSHSIFGNFYYQSNDENYDILFSRTFEPITGNWILSPNTGMQALFYNNSTNTGVFPVSNWIRTGFQNGISGYNPPPSFSYINQFTGRFETEILKASNNLNLPYFNNFALQGYKSSQGVSLIYGNHTNPPSGFNNPTWLIVDNYSSGFYYRNDLYNSTSIPQTGWRVTGFMNYSGRNATTPNAVLGNSSGVNLVIGSRTGFISSYDPTYGKIYIPFYY